MKRNRGCSRRGLHGRPARREELSELAVRLPFTAAKHTAFEGASEGGQQPTLEQPRVGAESALAKVRSDRLSSTVVRFLACSLDVETSHGKSRTGSLAQSNGQCLARTSATAVYE